MTTTTILSDNGVSSGSAGIKTTGGDDGKLALQTTTSGGTATTAVTIDNSQNVGIGTSSPSVKLQVNTVATNGSSLQAGPVYLSGYSSSTYISGQASLSSGGVFTAQNTGSGTIGILGSGNMTFSTDSGLTAGNTFSPTERMRIDSSGNLLVGTSNGGVQNANSMQYLVSNAQGYVTHVNGTGTGTGYWIFGYNGSNIGSITQNGTTGVLYNLTSDYRLKNNPEALTGAKEFVMALQPKKWQWWDGSGEGVGFIAHEFMEVAKYSGHGEKDAVDEDGSPVYQSIQPSSSEVMANLVAFIQEQQAIIEQLRADVEQLKNK